jgi:hypothetical protein
MRGFLQAIIPFLVPFLVYFAWTWLSRRRELESPGAVPWIGLSGAGLVLSATALLLFAEMNALSGTGVYEPARFEGGRVIDGGMRPAPR